MNKQQIEQMEHPTVSEFIKTCFQILVEGKGLMHMHAYIASNETPFDVVRKKDLHKAKLKYYDFLEDEAAQDAGKESEGGPHQVRGRRWQRGGKPN